MGGTGHDDKRPAQTISTSGCEPGESSLAEPPSSRSRTIRELDLLMPPWNAEPRCSASIWSSLGAALDFMVKQGRHDSIITRSALLAILVDVNLISNY